MAYYGYSEVGAWIDNLIGLEETNPGYLFNDALLNNIVFSDYIDLVGNAPVTPEERYAIASMHHMVNTLQNYIKGLGYSRMLFSHSYAGGTREKTDNNGYYFEAGFYNLSDIICYHAYKDKKNEVWDVYYKRADERWEQHHKPFIMEEAGFNEVPSQQMIAIYCMDPTGTDFHKYLWASAMHGGASTCLHWWWDRGLYYNNYQGLYKGISSFFHNEQLGAKKYDIKREKDKLSPSDNAWDKVKMEHYYMVSQDGERALGWVCNSTYRWRNYPWVKQELLNLQNTGSTTNTCLYLDGTPTIYNLSNLLDEDFEDDYSNSGPVPLLNEKIKIKDLKSNALNFGTKHYYQVDFYNTQNQVFSPVNSLNTLIEKTNGSGNLKITLPDLVATSNSFWNKDVCYKVTYRGKLSSPPPPLLSPAEEINEMVNLSKNLGENISEEIVTNDSLVETTNEDIEFRIAPNPASNYVTVNCSDEILNIKLYTVDGSLVKDLDFESNKANFSIQGITPGIYLVLVYCDHLTLKKKLIIQ